MAIISTCISPKIGSGDDGDTGHIHWLSYTLFEDTYMYSVTAGVEGTFSGAWVALQ